jgi:hypothetical protein
MSSDDGYAGIGGFAASLNSRLGAQARASKAIGFAWLCGGAATAACLTASGVSLAFLGYSHMISVKPASDEIAKALVTALQQTELKTNVSGSVSLSPDSRLRLADGQNVKLDQSSSIIKLDPNASVRVIGDLKVDVPQPSKEQLQQETTSKSDDVPITDYTIFRSAAYGSGQVISGWSYDLSDTVRPKFQYCYYTEDIERGLATRLPLAVNGSVLPPSNVSKSSFDLSAAAANCFWFSGF